MNLEHRQMRNVEVRAIETDDGRPGVDLQTITPNVVDDYGSVWMADTFDESLEERLPTLCWSHDWSDPLGPGVDFETSPNGPRVRFVFSDFDAVPQARRAHAQCQDGTIRDCSVGFSNVQRRDPTDDERVRWPGVVEVIEKADLDEVSLVLRGAVPGAKVLAVRTKAGQREVPEDLVIDLARKVSAGELSQDEAKIALGLAAGEQESGSGDAPPADTDPAGEPDPDAQAANGEADAALATLGLG